MTTKIRLLAITAVLAVMPFNLGAQQIVTLQQCRDSAIANNKNLKIAEQKITIAGYDKKIAFANYFPNISATAAYMYNSRDFDLLSKGTSDALQNAGTSAQNAIKDGMGKLMAAPGFSQIIQNNPQLLKLLTELAATDIATPINAIGAAIDDAFRLDINNVFLGAVSLQQPVFMGGKIVNANKIAKLAEELAKSQYETQYRAVVAEVDQAYWQIVSIANKVKLAQDYSDLLHQLKSDAEVMEAEGVATPADILTIKVKTNEADILLTKAKNGLVLSKMLLCKLCGIDLYSDIMLADESLDMIPVPQMSPVISNEEVFEARSEIKSLDLATQIYDKKVRIARADMMPKIALTANYFLTNPNLYHGWDNKFAGVFNVGVAINVPIIHGCEAMQKVRKAKAEAVLTRYQFEDAKEKITLQVTQLRRQQEEALEKLTMAENNLDSAEENLRTATVGFNEGVISSSNVLEAQTAWVKAHSEYIDAGVELQLCAVNLANAEGRER